MLVCSEAAIAERQKGIGTVEVGTADGVNFVQGRLKVGDIHTTSLIKHVKQNIRDEEIAILDAPPGTSCPVVEAVRETDLVLLVTEPTPFGLNDLKLAVGMVRQLGLDLAVVVNRSDGRNVHLRRYCVEEDIDIILEIRDDRRIAEAYSSGRMLIDDLAEYQPTFALFCAFLEGQRPKGQGETESEHDVQGGAESHRYNGRLAGPPS
jgi:MinD superfamily P-loop ATPase